MDSSALHLRLICGRSVSYCSYGAVTGRPVFALHGTPGSHLKFAAASAMALQLGLRLIALDRWCYGQTEAPLAPTFAGFAADVAEIADRLGIDRFAVIGISGGGPFAAAVAAELGARVTALALVAPVGPIVGIVPPPKLLATHHVAFRILPFVPGAIACIFSVLRWVSRRSPRLATRLAAGRALRADQRIVRDDQFATNLGQTFAAGLARNVRGPVIDLQMFARAWHVPLAATVARTRIWIGDDDRNVPRHAVAALARELGRGACRPTVVNLLGHGHYWIAHNFSDVLGWITAEV